VEVDEQYFETVIRIYHVTSHRETGLGYAGPRKPTKQKEAEGKSGMVSLREHWRVSIDHIGIHERALHELMARRTVFLAI
jgi:hypothetical protein